MDSQGALGDIINSLLNNPEIMKTVSDLAKSTSAEEAKDTQKENSEKAAEGKTVSPELLSSLPQLMSTFASSPEKGGGHNSDRKALLRALKPFLSEKRCDLIDGILQFEGLAGVLDAFIAK